MNISPSPTSSCLETEIKVLGVNYTLLVSKLKKLWAHKVGSTYIKDWYMTPSADITSPETYKRLKKKTIRLRAYGDEKFEVTVKSKVKPQKSNVKKISEGNKKSEMKYKVKQEDNTEVSSIKAGMMLLQMMGCQPAWTKEKIRVTYMIEAPGASAVQFDIDFYDDLPPVLEIEATPAQIQHYIRALGLSSYKQTTRGTKKLFRHYGKEVERC